MAVKKIPILPALSNEEKDRLRTINDNFSEPILDMQWKPFSVTLEAAASEYRVRHNLGAVPSAILIVWQEFTGTAGTVTINHSLFTSTEIALTATQPCKIRGLVGIFKG